MPRPQFPRVFSFAPVEELLADAPNLERSSGWRGEGWPTDTGPSDRTLGALLGVTRRTIQRWRHDGLTELDADAIATRLGHHPSALWGEQWWRSLVRCARPTVAA